MGRVHHSAPHLQDIQLCAQRKRHHCRADVVLVVPRLPHVVRRLFRHGLGARRHRDHERKLQLLALCGRDAVHRRALVGPNPCRQPRRQLWPRMDRGLRPCKLGDIQQPVDRRRHEAVHARAASRARHALDPRAVPGPRR
eukprot:Amastigsp_a841018_539.p3 type:complete len:140 gc:universal Amastigsp_a841018_539:689-1108(+)